MIVLTALLSGIQTNADAQEKRLLHAIIVSVNGDRITQEELETTAEYLFKRKYPSRPFMNLTMDESEFFSKSALHEMIKLKLLRQDAEQRGLTLEKNRLEGQFLRMGITDRRPSRVERNFAEGETLFDQIMINMGYGPMRPSPREVKKFWKKHKDDVFVARRQVKVRHIFFSTADANKKRVKAQAELIYQAITSKPEDKRLEFFAKTAEEFSQDAFRRFGGLLRISGDPTGWFNQEFINLGPDKKPLFPEEMVKGIRGLLQKDSVSPLIQSGKGYHILFLEDVKGGKQMTFAKAQKLIEHHLEQVERRERLMKWLRHKLERSNIAWHDGEPYPVKELLGKELTPDDARERK